MDRFKQGWINGQRKLANAIIRPEIKDLAYLIEWYKDLEEIAEGKKIINTDGTFTTISGKAHAL